MGRYYTIVKGDTLSAIAGREGLASYHVLYNATGPDGKKNRDRLRSGDPNLIYPNEVIWIPTGKKAGKQKKKCRRFCTGVSPVRVALGGDGVIKPAENIAAIYVPTKWGGKLKVEAVRVSDGTPVSVRLYYKDGSYSNSPKSDELHNGTNKLGDFGQPFLYDVPRDRKGWFFAEVAGKDEVRVTNTFSQEHRLTRTVWNSWWWPAYKHYNPNLYDWTVSYTNPSAPSDDGPLVKYDKYTGAYSEVTVLGSTISRTSPARDKEWQIMGTGQSSGSTAGHCDAISWAGLAVTRPSGNKSVTDPNGNPIAIEERDKLGLCTERHWVGTNGEVDVDEPGTTHHAFRKQGASNLDAKWFHAKLRTRIADNVGGMIVYDSGNFNFGIFGYRAVFDAVGTSDSEVKDVRITTDLIYRDWGYSGNTKWTGGADKDLTTKYKLRYKDDGTIERQLSWARESARSGGPYTITKVYYKKRTAPIINSKLDKGKLETLYS